MKKIILGLTILTIILLTWAVKAEEKNMKTLVVYFSRTGEQYSVGNITKGNTAIVAEMIANETNGDLFEVKLQNDNYPAGYTELTQVAKQEKSQNTRPAIIGDIENFDDYDVVFVGSPVWWADMPMALYTFIEKHDWSGKTVVPFVTHEGSGLSAIPANLKKATGAKTLSGLAVYGHEAQNSQDKVKAKVSAWLKELGF